MRYLILTLMALLLAAPTATSSYAQDAGANPTPTPGADPLSTEKLRSEADSSLFRMDFGPRCDNPNWLSIGLDTEHTCVTSHDTYECNETEVRTDGTTVTRSKCTIDAIAEDTIQTPVMYQTATGELIPALHPDTRQPIMQTTTRVVTDRRGYYGSLGAGRTLSLDFLTGAFEGAATAASKARVFVLGNGSQYIAAGHGDYLKGAAGSPFEGMVVIDQNGNQIGGRGPTPPEPPEDPEDPVPPPGE